MDNDNSKAIRRELAAINRKLDGIGKPKPECPLRPG